MPTSLSFLKEQCSFDAILKTILFFYPIFISRKAIHFQDLV